MVESGIGDVPTVESSDSAVSIRCGRGGNGGGKELSTDATAISSSPLSATSTVRGDDEPSGDL